MPDEEKLIAASAKATVEALTQPIASVLDKLFGPAAEEVGLSLKDSVQVWRAKRRLRLMQSLEAFIVEAGFDPVAVSPKLLFAAIDAASVEEDDFLQDRWAALLANAADPKQKQDKRLVHVSILKELSAAEVRFLQALYDHVTEAICDGTRSAGTQGFGWEVDPNFVYKQVWQEEYFDLSLIDNLERLNLIRRSTRQTVIPNADGTIEIVIPGTIEQTYFYFTELAFFFVESCNPPTTAESQD